MNNLVGRFQAGCVEDGNERLEVRWESREKPFEYHPAIL